MQSLLHIWHESARVSLGLFWMAFWAFALGYLVSSMIQVFVTRSRMRASMGEAGPRSVALGSFFGFLSSSCSFAALSTTRSLFAKGAGLVPALAFMLASTNLVVELGIIITVFLSWQFVVGEYAGGFLLILLMWLLVRLTLPAHWEQAARDHAREAEGDGDEEDNPDWRKLITSREGWRQVAHRYMMEWDMVWKDVTIGFTLAGIIATAVPRGFFQALFPGAGLVEPGPFAIVGQALIGPVAAFFTFIGSMGNIPLAAVLFGNGVGFAGVMAFIFSDLVVFPVLRIQARYYGWRMALYILCVLLVALVVASVGMHYVFAAFGLLPDPGTAHIVSERTFFHVDHTLVLNLAGIPMTLAFAAWKHSTPMRHGHAMHHGGQSAGELLLTWLARTAFAWLAVGMALPLFGAA